VETLPGLGVFGKMVPKVSSITQGFLRFLQNQSFRGSLSLKFHSCSRLVEVLFLWLSKYSPILIILPDSLLGVKAQQLF